jgi:6,7-dimethyl-8-ribityllumazine synthase
MKHIKADPLVQKKPFPIAVIVSTFNQNITQELQRGALQRLAEKGFSSDEITLIEVPGAVEIPLIAKQLAKKKFHGAIIALGAVIRGETTHYDYVCQQVSNGCQQVALEFDIPVVFGVLTTENEAQARDRVGGAHGHKGMDAVDCAIDMHAILQQL